MPHRISSPRLIGRESQLQHLQELYARAAAGAFTLALIKGDAGIGKSRLVRELEASEALSLRGACFPIAGEEAPYGPLVAALRDVPVDRLEAAASQLPESTIAELALLLPALGRQAPAGRDSSRGAQGRQYEYLLELLARLADETPVVLVVEDIHWADPSTLDFLSFVARNARRERVLLVATHRLHDGRDLQALERYVDQLERCPTVETIALDPLDEAQVSEQIEAILQRPADVGITRRITARTQGNPFYVEELIAHGHTAEAPLPPGQAAALLERVRTLSAETQHVLQVLAAFGRAIEHDLLAEAVATGEPELSSHLRTAVDSHVIVADGSTLTFRHALTREAVYDALLPGERRRLHAAVAGALREHPDLTDAAELAVQWRAAGEPAAALAASLEAARAATGVYAYNEAVEHYTAAVTLWSSAEATGLDRAQMLLDAADAAYRAGADDLPIQWCELGLAALGDDPDPRRAAVFLERLGRFQDHHLDKSLTFYGEALERLDETASAERARLLSNESLTLTLSVRWHEARERAQRALAVAQEAEAEAEEGYARSVLGLVLAYLGEFEDAEAHLHESLRIGQARGRPEDVTGVYVHLGEVRRLRGDLPGALEVMAAGLETAQQLGVEASYGRYFALNAAEDEFELGRWDAAQARIDQLEGASLTWTETLLRLTVSGQLAAGRGAFEQARAWLDEASGLLRESSATEWTAYVGACVIELALTAGEPDEALVIAAAELERVRGREERLYTPALIAVAVRAAADAGAPDEAERLTAWLSDFLDESAPPIALAHLAGALAESARARSASSAEQWEGVANVWDRLEHPYRAAYARVREAEARLAERDRDAAAQALAKVLDVAQLLGAAPLEQWAEDLVKRKRLRNAVVRQLESAGPEDRLTRREREVLGFLSEGRTNREIAAQLHITEGTAALHVSHILGKLGVSNRGQAAAIARRGGAD
ncbi:AAA family ATPase [Solirubrobacter phytolaccae]|uniref:AAA family ATPase n=1 Tax=Solirubrobacter phytolaccae TaxID=1404360 RepID=A0A9X3N300_9ACTN|nr:LuxR family transcriptional regulator [Solirubrobacter phytolaccae]MDA0178768.1 AAA family ATPase [Solirubrobacter phytolaccae]